MKYISQDVENLKKQLDSFLFKRKEPIVISLQGYWGIGKTYFWHNYIKYKEQEDKHVYISLFGINSLDDIKRKIILKISDRAKISQKLQDFIGSSKVFGIDLASIMSIIDKSDFQDIIICFDDFERISPNLSISEVLGLISELKEQHKCKIVLINNNEILKEQDTLNHQKIIKYKNYNQDDKNLLEDLEQKELMQSICWEEKKTNNQKKINSTRYIVTSTNNYEIFNQFSEKIVDVKVRYEPSIDDLVNILKDKEKSYIDFDFIAIFFNSLKDNNNKFNIRLMKQIILKLEVIKVLLEDKNIDDSFKRGMIFNISRLVVKENISVYDLRKAYYDFNAEYKEYEKELFNLVYRHNFKIYNIKNIFIEKTNSIIELAKISKLKENLEAKYYQYLYDMQYGKEKFTKEFFEMMKDSEYDLVSLLSLQIFYGYIDFLKIKNYKF